MGGRGLGRSAGGRARPALIPLQLAIQLPGLARHQAWLGPLLQLQAQAAEGFGLRMSPSYSEVRTPEPECGCILSPRRLRAKREMVARGPEGGGIPQGNRLTQNKMVVLCKKFGI